MIVSRNAGATQLQRKRALSKQRKPSQVTTRYNLNGPNVLKVT